MLARVILLAVAVAVGTISVGLFDQHVLVASQGCICISGHHSTPNNPCTGQAGFSVYVNYFPCDTVEPWECILSVDISGTGAGLQNCNLTIAAWCDSSNHCGSSPNFWASGAADPGSGTVVVGLVIRCECGTTIAGSWAAFLDGMYCSCDKGCYNAFTEGDWLCVNCVS